MGDDIGKFGVPGGHKNSIFMQDRNGNNYIVDNTTQTPVKVTIQLVAYADGSPRWAWTGSDGTVYYYKSEIPTVQEASAGGIPYGG